MRKTDYRKSLLFMGIILLCLGLLARCREKAPEILSISPRIGWMGDILTIQGGGFGNDRNESYITIAGTPPTSSSYISWRDTEISVRIPEFGEAGLIYVYRGQQKSNPALFVNQATLPEPMLDLELGNNPRISSIEPASGAIGSLITIQGSNFGPSRENSGVFFPWDNEPLMGKPAGTQGPYFVEAFDTEFGYELWSEREIRVRVPDGAISGNLEIRTPKGKSKPVFFEISGRPGTKTFREKRNYTFSYTVDINVNQAAVPNALYIWMPRPALSSSQRNVRFISRTQKPFIENYRGTSLFQFIDIHSMTSQEITLSYTAEVYAVETNIKSQTPVRLNKPSPLAAFYALPSASIPSDNLDIKNQAAEIIGRERLPYAKAEKIYEWLLSSVRVFVYPLQGGIFDALEQKQADSYQAAMLFCALARAVEIPALPVAGILIDRQRNSTKHYWAEFWLDGFGWVPLDPALGAGAAPVNFNLTEDHAKYYFGNLDNQRLAFSRGEHYISRMAPNGRTTQRSREYSLQNIWEEATGGLESYSSLWSDVTITGMYSN